MMKYLKLCVLFIFILFPLKLDALIEVDITRGNLNPLPIAVSALYADNDTIKLLKKEIKIDQIGNEISKIIENNLRATGLFNPLEKKAFLRATQTLRDTPWKAGKHKPKATTDY